MAKKLEGRVAELEPISDQAGKYKAALDKYLETEKKDLPKHILSLLEKLDPVEQIEYLVANKEAISKAGGGGEGVPPSPSPRQRQLSDDEKEAARRGQPSLYNNF